jgi:DNA-binding winged helix-turn-helix (wHTH) protein
MAFQHQTPTRLAFGPFEVNVPAGQLLKGGIRIRLSGQPFQVLLTLLTHPGDVVTNEQLCQQIWKEGTFVDFEHGLHAAVNKLRRALGDSAESPRYIETVPGRGYRFIGAMGRQPLPISSEAGSLGIPLPPRANGELPLLRSKPGRRWWIAAAVTLPLVALGIWEASRVWQTVTDERVLRLQIDPPEGSEFTFGTQAAGISLSPDGKTAAYIATDLGKAVLWVRPLDGATARALAGTEDAGSPFWSPDSKSVAFFAHGKLQRVYLAGRSSTTGRRYFRAAVFCTLSGAPSARIAAFMRHRSPNLVRRYSCWPRTPTHCTHLRPMGPTTIGKDIYCGCAAEHWWRRTLTRSR